MFRRSTWPCWFGLFTKSCVQAARPQLHRIRRLPAGGLGRDAAGEPRLAIVMKLDTEGGEYKLLPHLIAQGVACIVDFLFLEWHPDWPPTLVQEQVRQSTHLAIGRCNHTVLSEVDDESFVLDGMRLPPKGSLCSAADANHQSAEPAQNRKLYRNALQWQEKAANMCDKATQQHSQMTGWLCYLTKHPDLHSAFGNDTKAARLHFMASGYAEGRDCNCDDTT